MEGDLGVVWRNSLLPPRGPRISNPMSAEVCIGTKRTKLVRESREGLGPSLVPSRRTNTGRDVWYFGPHQYVWYFGPTRHYRTLGAQLRKLHNR